MAQRNKLNREACASLPRLFWALIWRSNRLAVLFINAGPNQQGRAARWSSRGLWRKSPLVAVSLTHVYCISFALMQSTNQIIFETKWTPRVIYFNLKSAWYKIQLNRPFPSSPGPLYQSEVRCSTSDMEMSFHCHVNKTHFHKKGWAPNLVLIQRPWGTRKWPIHTRQWLPSTWWVSGY